MRISCADYSFPSLPHAQALALVSLLGFDGVDVGLFAGRSAFQPVSHPSQVSELVAPLRHTLLESGLEVADVFVQITQDFHVLSINDPDETVRREAVRRLIVNMDVAAQLGSSGMTVLPGVTHAVGQAASMELAAESLSTLVLAAADRGLALSVEAHVESLIDTVDRTEDLLGMTPGLNLTLDHAHYVRRGERLSEIDRLVPRARHVQARGATRTELQASMADNVIDFPAMVDHLASLHYSGWIATEYVWSPWYECNRVDNLTETVALRDLLRKAIPSQT